MDAKLRSKVHQIWCEYFGFEPDVIASFDHITSGLPSRILVGYERFAQMFFEQNSISIVLDTIVPARERPCGVSLELGLVPNKLSICVEHQEVFFFLNKFNFNFFSQIHKKVAEQLERMSNLPKRKKEVVNSVVMGRMHKISNLWGGSITTSDILNSRAILQKELGLSAFPKERQVLLSTLLPTMARVLDVVCGRYPIEEIEECPLFTRTGIARIVNEDGTEGERRVYKITDSLLERIARKEAIPTAPMMLLLIIVIPGFQHYGNDYSMIEELSNWFRIDSAPQTCGDGKNSWPVGRIVQRGREHINSFVDLLHYPWEWYSGLIKEAAERGREVFKRNFADFVVF